MFIWVFPGPRLGIQTVASEMEQRTWIEPEPGPNSGYLQKFRLYETRAVYICVFCWIGIEYACLISVNLFMILLELLCLFDFRFVFILIVFVFSLCVVLYFALCFLFFSSISIHYPWKYLFLSEVRDSALRRWIVCIDCIGAVTGRGRRNICSAHISNEWWAVLA